LKVQIRCAAGSVPDGLQMTLKLEGNLTSQQKERLLQVSGTQLIQLVYYVAFTCIYFGHCFDVAQFYQKDGDEIKELSSHCKSMRCLSIVDTCMHKVIPKVMILWISHCGCFFAHTER